MRLTPGHIQKMKRLEGVRVKLIEALQQINPVPTVIPVGDEYKEAQCIIHDWIEMIEKELSNIEEHLTKEIIKGQGA